MMKRWLDAVWRPFDKEDALEWYLLIFGWTILAVFLLVEFL